MEEKKLTDEATIDSLKEMAIKFSKDIYVNRVLANAIDLIYRSQDENEELKYAREMASKESKQFVEYATKINADQKAEIARLNGKYRNLEINYNAVWEDFRKYEIENAELQKQVDELKAENTELYKEHTALIAGSILAKQNIPKDTAKKILDELDLFFKGTTFRKGYEFKKIDQKLKEMRKNYNVELQNG